MSSFPSSIDSSATLYSPVDAFSTKPLETTTTTQVLAGDTTISVQSTSGGFADAYGIVSIDDELIIYTGKNSTQFTGCQRGTFGTQVAQHAQGATVRANMVSAFITALQSAVLAIENELGTVVARNYVRANGDQTVTGVKTFPDGANFGSGTKAATGLVRLPNSGAMKWRKADNSGDLGMALGANDHIAVDAVIDWAPGQTFGSPAYPDATTTRKGIVQIDPVGGLSVSAGVVSLATTAITPGTYTKLTVDSKGRATVGAFLTASDLPSHTHVAGDIVSGSLPFTVQKAGSPGGTRRALNLVEGANVQLTAQDDSANDRVSVTVACASPFLLAGLNAIDSPLKVSGPGSNLPDDTLLEVTAAGELILAGGAGNGYRFAELMGASNPSGWSGVIKVKNPAGVTAGYILLYSNP